MADNNELLNLKVNQMTQILEQYRMDIYNLELRLSLLIKMVEEKGIFAGGEYEKRWPLYLKNDIGAMGQNGVMEGSLKVHLYNV